MEKISKMDKTFTIKASRNAEIEIPVSVNIPELREGEKVPVVIFVHGFLGNKDEYGMFYGADMEEYGFVSFARQLQQLGIGSIRVDQPGTGDSKDDFRNYTLTNCISDIKDAYNYCMKEFPFDSQHVGVIAYSMGAKVCAEFVLESPEINPLVLLNPAGDNGNNSILHAAEGALDYPNLEKVAMRDGEVLNPMANKFTGGDKPFVLSKAFFEEVNASKTGDVFSQMPDKGKNVLLIYGGEDTIITKSTYEELVKNAGLNYVCIPGMEHDLGFECARPDLTNIVINITNAFLYRYLKESLQYEGR